MRYGITGVRDIGDQRTPAREHALRVIAWALMDLEDVTEVTTGAQYGVDTQAFFIASELHPDAHHRVCVPAGVPHNEHLVRIARIHGREVVEVPGGYLARNDRIVASSDVLVAFPRTENEELRSGTWATIRRARRAGIQIRLHPLEVPADRRGVDLRAWG